MESKPRIWVLGAGGTIAGTGRSATHATYQSGQLAASELLAAVDGLEQVAELQAETLFSKGSEDLGPSDWRTLALRINTLTARPDVDGVVVTHGTDTLEEAAFFLELVYQNPKPVVLTAAMRPATALSADGPANLYQAVLACTSPRLRGGGVLVTLNGLVLPGWQTIKTDSVAVETFCAYPGGPLARIVGNRLQVFAKPVRAPMAGIFHALLDRASPLPTVGIVPVYGGCNEKPLALWQHSHGGGMVIASFGAGTVPEPMAALARDMAAAGCLIVISSRVRNALVLPETMTLQGVTGVIAAGYLNPQKSALLLSLALAAGLKSKAITALFEEFSCIPLQI